MKKLFVLAIASLFFTSCTTESIPKNCGNVEPEEVLEWVKDFYEKEQPEYYWIGSSVYKGETVYYTNYMQSGAWFCGFGIEPSDMYVFFDCEGQQIGDKISWDELGSMEHFYDDFPPQTVEEEEGENS